jgi:hypothetical protein
VDGNAVGVRLGERRQNANCSLTLLALESFDQEAQSLASADASRVSGIIAMHPYFFFSIALRTLRRWRNLPLVIFRDILLRIHRNWLDQLQLAQRQSRKRQQVQFVFS